MTTQKSRNPTLLIQHSIKPLVVMGSLDAGLKLRTYSNVAFFPQHLLPVQAGYAALIFGTVLFCLPRGNRLVSEIGRIEGEIVRHERSLVAHFASASTMASCTSGRTWRMACDIRFGQVRLVSNVTESWRAGSIHRDVPVKPR